MPFAILLIATLLRSFKSLFLCAFLFLISIFLSASAANAENNSNYMGTASCSSSNCHGNSAPVQGSKVLQNEFVTWFRHDSHSKAYNVLLNEQSKRIAYNLGIKSAEQDSLCLSCHATFIPKEDQKGDKYRVNDGVSCESCHGASGKWLKQHVASDASHEKNIELGMTDLSKAAVKTELCLSCHIGNDDKTVNHRLIGAGHPRLTFELDTFESVMPRHWDPKNLDKNYDPTLTWLNAQATQAKERTKALYSKTRSHAGLMPEFSNLHCYSCHHALSQKQYQSREYGGRPGEPNLNTSELWILSKALVVLDKNKAEQLASKINKLRESFGKEDSTAIGKEITTYLDKEIIPLLASKKLSPQQQQQIFSELISASHLNLQYETAEQIAMGAAAIAAANPESVRMKEEVSSLYAALENPDMFDPQLFKKARDRSKP